MAVNDPTPPNQVVVKAEPTPPQPSPPANVTILPVQTIHGHQADDGRLAALEAKFEAGMAELRSALTAAVKPPEPKVPEPDPPEPVLAVTPPPAPPDPAPNPTPDPGPRKRGFLEKFLHAGCPDK